MITTHYVSIDRFCQTRKFKTLKGARRYAQRMLGEHPEISTLGYAVSDDGVGKLAVSGDGVRLADLFPSAEAPSRKKSEAELEDESIAAYEAEARAEEAKATSDAITEHARKEAALQDFWARWESDDDIPF